MLYGIAPGDPGVILAAAVHLAVGAAASALPVPAAARLDPAVTMRGE